MADINTVQDIINYYVNLLIIQYHDQPKAQAEIALMAEVLLANGVIFDVRDGYNIDTAIGHQLDIIGKYVGTDRYFTTHDLINFFGLTFYTDVDPDSQEKFGFVQYANFNEYQYNGTLNYHSLLSQSNALSDTDFRTLIHLKILQNNINHSHKSINDAIFDIFGNSVVPDSTGGMKMIYFISQNFSAVVSAALTKQLLPKPMGVQITLIINVSAPFFGFATYESTPGSIEGFATYANYDTSVGEFLIYSQMST